MSEPTLGDRIISASMEQQEGIRVETAADVERLWLCRIEHTDACCWPARTKLRLVRSGVRSMMAMHGRLSRLRPGWFFRLKVGLATRRFAAWTPVLFILSWLLPPCWCRKKEKP